MKQGTTLQGLTEKLFDIAESAQDHIASGSQLHFSPEGRLIIDQPQGCRELAVTKHAHGQIGEKLGIPAKYYNLMLEEARGLLAANVNHWLASEKDKRHMVRTLSRTAISQEAVARAFLSNKFHRIDNFRVAQYILPFLLEQKDLQIKSCEVTDSRMYIKATLPHLKGEVRVGDVVVGGIVISNSEIGMGRLNAVPFTETLRCTNGMSMDDNRFSRAHLGRGSDGGDDWVENLLSDETRAKGDEVVLCKMRDVVKGMLTMEVFETFLGKLRGATEDKITTPVLEKPVETLAKTFNLADFERSKVLEHFLGGRDFTRYGMAQAVTRTAEDVGSYDRATELEGIGGKVINLPRDQWKAIATAE